MNLIEFAENEMDLFEFEVVVKSQFNKSVHLDCSLCSKISVGKEMGRESDCA